jgi:transposase-like protein
MNCPQCSAEMTKKWHPRTAMKLAVSQWACGVCGCQHTHADMKTATKERDEAALLRGAGSIPVK